MRHFNRRGKTATPPTRGHLPGTSSARPSPATCQPVNTALRGGTWSPGFPVSTDSLHTLSTEAGWHFLHGLPTPSCTPSRDALRPGMWGPSSGVQSPDRPLPNTRGPAFSLTQGAQHWPRAAEWGPHRRLGRGRPALRWRAKHTDMPGSWQSLRWHCLCLPGLR